ncbi:D-alanyl-D-alanine carboxypeptidase family protein [Azonexus sp.]|jgi:D-alanyl-D-alanine carboxypeptidase (penicillin-binding protein 5/6)|uniref:D-alanyl-D-alanine carboxypeptidase family protein n=1 Tax=Azonexus sp. TaxID=1872668 RepID=UPI0028394B1D|nr:D-alanyl-D-alanine carboxypeptidase family protein [Azonexus sp.]MDR1995710.1 D-alanyl-D-alanine carboxypeptidase [Azonexus sp.]
MSLFRQVFLILTALLCATQAIAQTQPVAPTLAAKSWLLLEVGSGQILSAEKPDEQLDPASLTKLMTAYLTFSALRQKTLNLNQTLPVSEKAWRTGGSKMFVRVGHQVAVDDLLKGVIVQSGNDACVVLAEGIAGSEENFAQMMNREAQRLDMKNSSFRNATGLPDPQHYTTARDLSLLAAALIRDFPEEYRRYYSMKEFSYNNIKQPNRNRLLWLDPTVDGMKTGHTEAAGYCLIASALRSPRRLLSVVLGTASDSTRISESLKLLNWGFLSYDAVPLYAKDQAVSSLRVWKGAQNQVKAGFESDFIIAVPKGMADKIKAELVSQQPLMAPVQAGQQIGTLKLSLDGQAYGDYPVHALESVPVAGIVGRAVDTVKLWFN